MEAIVYDTAIIGGGLAGLNLSIQLAQQGFNVVLFEKETYPYHKVCGEYISLESWHFLNNEIGIPLEKMNLPIIKKLWVTSPNGSSLHAPLPLGGFGVSRYTLDFELKQLAKQKGVQLLEDCKATDVQFNDELFTIQTTKGIFKSKVCAGSWGKRSNVDVKWKRRFLSKTSSRLNNYVGIKYHVTMDFPDDVIALHNFKDGYCGMSKIEDGKYCVCYLTKSTNIKKAGNSIEKAEQFILSENPHLKHIFQNMKKLYDAPLSISQVSFSKKDNIENHVLMLGDAAGMITPLCGNGMSMAMHGSKLAAQAITSFLNTQCNRASMEQQYSTSWRKQFATRLATGKTVQYLFGRKLVTNILVNCMKRSKRFTQYLIRLTHGKPF